MAGSPGGTADSADPRIARLVACAALGAFLGDNLSYLMGRLGGKAFEVRPWAGFLVAFGGTVVVSVLVETVRRIRSRRKAARTVRRLPESHC
jgi:hypothetical protein